MNNESNKVAGKMLKSNISQLFDEAEVNIARAEKNNLAQREKERLEQDRKANEKKVKTEAIANAIISLVYNTLTTADSKTGKINKIDRKLGLLTDDDDSKSGYVIDDDGLTITLDYSHVTYDMDTSGGICFLGECGKKWDPNAVYYGSLPNGKELWEKNQQIEAKNEPFDYDYLNEILNEYGISMSRENSSECPGMEWEYTDIVTIKTSRQPKKTSQNALVR